MKREEKNQISRQRILESAAKEFAEKGYGLSSINVICAEGDISKGILYHYFKDKDELYLTCVQACFDGLTAALKAALPDSVGDIQTRMDQYFAVRWAYFDQHPDQLRLFCEALLSASPHLRPAIAEARLEFDRYNMEILDTLLGQIQLRPDFTREEVIDLFRQAQDFINAQYAGKGQADPADGKEREQLCQRALAILLYGVVDAERKGL